MLKNACLLAKIGAGTAEKERHFAKIWRGRGGPPAGAWRTREEACQTCEVLANFAGCLVSEVRSAENEDEN